MQSKIIEFNHQKFFYKGNSDLLNRNPVAFLCSRKIPIGIYLSAIPFLEKIFDLPIALAGGWHSPVEKRMFKYLRKDSKASIIVFPAKSLNSYRINKKLNLLIEKEKGLVLSPFGEEKITYKTSSARNRYLLNFCNRFLFLSIFPGGNLDEIFELSIKQNKKIFVFDHSFNSNYFTESSIRINLDNMEALLDE